MTTFRAPSRRGFTLIELLVVIAIILILAALLFPAVGVALRQSRRAFCLQQTKQIAALIYDHAQNNNLFLPDAAGPWGLPDAMADTVRNPNVYRCPGDRFAFEQHGSSYIYPTTTAHGIQEVSGRKLTFFSYPSKKVILYEPAVTQTSSPVSGEYRWHTTGMRASVMGFLDGHSSFVELGTNVYTSVHAVNHDYY